MLTYGPEAVSPIVYMNDHPFVAAASWGAGKVMAMPDHQALEVRAGATSANMSAVLLHNTIRWMSRNGSLPSFSRSTTRVATLSTGMTGWCQSVGYDATTLSHSSVASGSLIRGGYDVLFAGWLGSELGDDTLAAVAQWVANHGGGLIVSDYGIGWKWWWGGIEKSIGNRVLREAGIGFTTKWPTGIDGLMYLNSEFKVGSAQLGAMSAHDALGTLAGGGGDDVTAATNLLTSLRGFLPRDDHLSMAAGALSCTSSSSAPYWDAATKACVSAASCPNGTWGDDGTGRCVPCVAPCLQCAGAADACTLCDAKSAYPLLNTTSRSCTPCGAGTYRSGEGRCVPCDASCGECMGPGRNNCTACRPGSEVTQEHTCRELCVADASALPNLFALDGGDGTKKLVVDRCAVGDPWFDKCSRPDTPTMEVTGAKYFVIGVLGPNMAPVCKS